MPVSDYDTDLKLVLDNSIRILLFMADIAYQKKILDTTLKILTMIQMVMQGLWHDDSSLYSLPYLDESDVCSIMNKGNVSSLCELCEKANNKEDIEMFARRLYNLDRAIDVNANAQKTPVLIQCEEQQRLTMKNLYKEYDGNSPVIYGDKNLNPKGLAVLKTDAPYVADKLYSLKTQIWNEALTYLGISNLNVQKKERLVSDEVVRSMGGTIASRYSRLQSRREAVEKINAMFGTEIEVNYRDDFREADDETMFRGATGDGTMGDVAVDLRTK
jgi:hypothetical protein